ncbi:MAG: hypothetical protein ABF271_12805 [Abyssibacter sp.]|uniref:hypothetical protein n=1 Tax=Abyssibacter sp. TaxID=2320200 RepID=UPI00321C1BF1
MSFTQLIEELHAAEAGIQRARAQTDQAQRDLITAQDAAEAIRAKLLATMQAAGAHQCIHKNLLLCRTGHHLRIQQVIPARAVELRTEASA